MIKPNTTRRASPVIAQLIFSHDHALIIILYYYISNHESRAGLKAQEYKCIQNATWLRNLL
jgi:hypothetical protein